VVRPGRSGYPIFSGRVIQNSGNEKCYPIFTSKKHYPKFWVPDNSGLGIPNIPEFTEKSKLQKTFIAILYIILATICINFNSNLQRIIYYSHLFKQRESYTNKVISSSAPLTTHHKHKDTNTYSGSLGSSGTRRYYPNYPNLFRVIRITIRI
jgi:hypothetical protein